MARFQGPYSTFDLSDLPEFEARLENARVRLRDPSNARLADSTALAALQGVADSLYFLATQRFFVRDDESDERPAGDADGEWAYLLQQAGIDQARRYAALVTDLENLFPLVMGPTSDLEDLLKEVDTLLSRTIALMHDIWSEETPMNSELWSEVGPRYSQLLSLRDSFSLWRRNLAATSRAENAADAAAESAGKTAEISLAGEFESLARRETSAANTFRALTIAIFAATGALAVYATYSPGSGELLLRKLSIGVPALLLGLYLARESSQHRRRASWASIIEAQLKSIRAFAAELAPESRDLLKTQFGQRVFLSAPEDFSAPVENSSATDGNAAQIIREAAEFTRAARGTT